MKSKSQELSELKPQLFDALFRKAAEAGMTAGQASLPQPMIVSDSKQQYFVEGGVCGFAWVNVKPGTSAFAKHLVKNKQADRDSYYGGVTIYVHEFGQSMTRKEAYARAFAEVLRSEGIEARSMSRMD